MSLSRCLVTPGVTNMLPRFSVWMVLGLEFASEIFLANFQDPDTKISYLLYVTRHSRCLLGHFDVLNPVFTHCDTDSGCSELMFRIFCLNIHEKAILDKRMLRAVFTTLHAEKNFPSTVSGIPYMVGFRLEYTTNG